MSDDGEIRDSAKSSQTFDQALSDEEVEPII